MLSIRRYRERQPKALHAKQRARDTHQLLVRQVAVDVEVTELALNASLGRLSVMPMSMTIMRSAMVTS
jgi:hypothetical protein